MVLNIAYDVRPNIKRRIADEDLEAGDAVYLFSDERVRKTANASCSGYAFDGIAMNSVAKDEWLGVISAPSQVYANASGTIIAGKYIVPDAAGKVSQAVDDLKNPLIIGYAVKTASSGKVLMKLIDAPAKSTYIGSYSAIVYKDDEKVYARDKAGNIIAIGKAGDDDAQIIQYAIDSLPSGGGLVVLSEGKFYISSTIIINKPIVFKGSGGIGAPGYPDFGGTLLYLVSNSNCDVIRVDDPNNYFYFVVLKQFQIWGNLDHNTNGGGIYVGPHSSDVLIYDVVVRAARGAGITMRPDHNGWINTVWVEDCRNNGIYGRTNNIWITNCCTGGNLPHNIYLKQFRDARIIGNSIWVGYPSITLDDFSHCKIIGNWFNGGSKFLELQSVTHSIISGNTFAYSKDCAIEMKASSYNSIADNTFDHCVYTGSAVINVLKDGSTYSDYNIFNGNTIFETSDNADYGIKEIEAGHDYWIITNNIFTGIKVAAIDMQGSHNIIYHNQGHTTKNGGIATILDGYSSVTVDHGLVGVPSNIRLTGTHSEVANCWVTDITDTQFTIHTSNIVTANRDVYWIAEIY